MVDSVDGNVWYNYLNRKDKTSLLGEFGGGVGRKLLVCRESPQGRKFASFETYLHFYAYMASLEKTSRCFYEIIQSSCEIKPYFDIDIEVIEGLAHKRKDFEMCCASFAKCAAEITGVPGAFAMVFTSYGSGDVETAKKLSFHVVVGGAKLGSIAEGKEFCNFAISEFSKQADVGTTDENVKKHFITSIDTCVYKNVQQFRMVGSSKFKADVADRRTKVLSEELSYATPADMYTNFRKQFAASLVSLTANCESVSLLGEFHRYVNTKKIEQAAAAAFYKRKYEITSSNGDSVSTDDTDVDQVIEAVKSEFEKLGTHDFPFEVRESKPSLIILARKAESFCPICDRSHTHDNPYVRVYPDGTARYFCRRDPKNRSILVQVSASSPAKSTSIYTSPTTTKRADKTVPVKKRSVRELTRVKSSAASSSSSSASSIMLFKI